MYNTVCLSSHLSYCFDLHRHLWFAFIILFYNPLVQARTEQLLVSCNSSSWFLKNLNIAKLLSLLLAAAFSIALRRFIAAFTALPADLQMSIIIYFPVMRARRWRRIPLFLRKEFIGPVTLQGHSWCFWERRLGACVQPPWWWWSLSDIWIYNQHQRLRSRGCVINTATAAASICCWLLPSLILRVSSYKAWDLDI